MNMNRSAISIIVISAIAPVANAWVTSLVPKLGRCRKPHCSTFSVADTSSTNCGTYGNSCKHPNTITRIRLQHGVQPRTTVIRSLSSDNNVVPSQEKEQRPPYVLEWKNCNSRHDNHNISEKNERGGHAFNAEIFASSDCWGRRPFLMRGAFDPSLLLSNIKDNEWKEGKYDDEKNESLFGDSSWPSWKEVVEIAADDESESRWERECDGMKLKLV